MAALGAAAGAFEGDMEREAAAARRAQLGLQAASLAQQDRQFAEGQKLQREDMALEADRIAGNQRLEAERTAMMQRNADKGFALDEQKLAYDKENDVYQRGRNEQQDAWKQALDEQEMQAKQLDMAFQKERLSQFKILADQEKQNMAERKRLAQTALASAMKIGMESGGVVPLSVVQAVAKETGIPFQGMYYAPDGTFVTDVLKDGQVVQEMTPPNVQATIMRSMPGVFGEEAAKDLVNERRDKARYDSYLQRESMKYENAKYIASLRGQRATRFDAKQLEAIDTDIYEYEKELKVKGLAPEKKARLEGQLKAAKEFRRSLIYGGEPNAAVYSAYGENIPAPFGAQGGGAGSGYTEQQMNELGGLKVQALREANGDKASGSKFGFVKGGTSSAGVVERTLKNGQKVRVRQLSNGKWEVVGGVPQEQAEPVMEEQPNKRSFRGVDGSRVTSSNGEVKRNFGPEPGTVEYWRDMPKGQATGMSKREIGLARRDILKRLEAAYRKGPKGRDEAAAVKAELDAFNDKYPV